MFQSPGAILLKLGPLTIRWYGMLIGLGCILAIAAATRLSKKMEINADQLINCILITFLGGLLGARLYFVALSWPHYQENLSDVLAIWKGGLSIHGGIIGGTITGLLYCYRAKLPMLKYADVISSAVPLAQSIGRWGNFFNSEAFGRPVPDDFLMRLYIPKENRPHLYSNNDYFHPTFLYESIWDFALFLLLYFVLVERLRKYPGLTFMAYLAGYSIGRLLIEPLRVDSIMIGGAQAPFVVSAVTLVVATLLALILVKATQNGSKEKDC